MRKKLILDLDTGIDDALAIAYALGSADEIDLIGITATYGNVAVPLAARNALAVLHLFGRDDVPVYPGVDHPIAPAKLPKMRWHHTRRAGPGLRALAERRRGRLANGRFVVTNSRLGGGPPSQRHRRRDIIPDSPRAPEAPGSAVDFIITAAREHRPGPDHRAYGRDDHHGHRIPQRSGPEGFRCERHADGRCPYIARQCKPGRRSEHLPRPRGSNYLFKCGARATMIGLDVTHQTALTGQSP